MIMASIGDLLLTIQVVAISVVAVIAVIGSLLSILEWIATDDK